MEQHVLEENSFMRVQDEATQTYSEVGESLKNNEEEKEDQADEKDLRYCISKQWGKDIKKNKMIT